MQRAASTFISNRNGTGTMGINIYPFYIISFVTSPNGIIRLSMPLSIGSFFCVTLEGENKKDEKQETGSRIEKNIAYTQLKLKPNLRSTRTKENTTVQPYSHPYESEISNNKICTMKFMTLFTLREHMSTLNRGTEHPLGEWLH